jgi:hypothetical protein
MGSPTPSTLVEVEALLKQGRNAEAIRLAYLQVEDDVRRAFGMKLPKQWTHREFLARYLRRDMGYITTLLPRLHALFEPVRYGDDSNASAETLLPLLRSAYQEPALRTLPLLPTAGPRLSARPRPADPKVATK